MIFSLNKVNSTNRRLNNGWSEMSHFRALFKGSNRSWAKIMDCRWCAEHQEERNYKA